MSVPVIATPSSLAMARSPQFITGKNNALTNDQLQAMSLNLRIGSGAIPSSGSFNYQLNKDYSINQVINFEVSDLVRSEFYHDFSIWNDVGFTQSPQGEVLWVVPTGDWRYSNNGAAPDTAVWATGGTYKYLTTDGWAPMTNISPTSVTQTLLATSRERQVLLTNYEVLPIYQNSTNEVTKVSIIWQGGGSDIQNITIPPSNDSRDAVVYLPVGPANLQNTTIWASAVKPSNNVGADTYDVEVTYANSSTAIIATYVIVCEPKYTPYQIAFINRFGVADFITFFKRSDERGNFTQDTYEKSIYNDGFTTPSLEVGKYTSFNVNSRNSLTLNTGFVDQDYDETIKDILMSEYVAVLENNQWIAVQPERGSIEYQKHINQKLINYTLTFNYAFDERSLVR
jgi:hypothetical protein